MGRLSLRCRGLSLLAFGRLGWVKLEGLLSECHNNIHTAKQRSGYLVGAGILTQNAEIRWKMGNLRAGCL